MAVILHIETATKNCSVSIAKAGKLLVLKEFNDDSYSHAEKLHALISESITEASLNFTDLHAIAVSKGPGSYTGLRIGVSAAKGLCYALDIPLISVSTLESMSNAVHIDKGYKVPMLDARRLEVYSAVFSSHNEVIREVAAEIITSDSFEDLLTSNSIHFFGDGASKCQEIIKHPNAFFIDRIFPSANGMIALAFNKFNKEEFENVAYFEPFYLKDFVAKVSKKSINTSN